jgi:hypothetical protein
MFRRTPFQIFASGPFDIALTGQVLLRDLLGGAGPFARRDNLLRNTGRFLRNAGQRMYNG